MSEEPDERITIIEDWSEVNQDGEVDGFIWYRWKLPKEKPSFQTKTKLWYN